MQVVTFTQAQTDLTQAYAGEHATWLVAFSILIAMLASFASFNHVQLIRRRELTNSRVSWTLLGAVALGSGVWAMHFTGMLSYQLPMDVNYHTGRTALSVVPAVLAGYVTLTVISKPTLQIRDVLVGGVLMGAGIGLMHYIGMSAMILPAERLYQPLMFVLSILIAIVLATLSLSVRPLLSSVLKHPLLLNLLASVFMGLAITSMHYVAMHATVFMPLSEAYQRPAVAMLDNSALVTIAVAAAVFIVLISSLAVVMRFRLLHVELGQKAAEAEARALEDRFRTIAERVPGMVYEFRLDASGQMSFPYTSDAVRDIYGVTPEEIRDDALILEQIIHPDDLPLVYQGIEESARTMQPWQSEYRVIRRTDGAERWLLGSAAPLPDADGAVIWSGVITDITERKKHDEMVYQLAFYDALTELPNRRLIYRQLEQKMADAQREGWCGVVIFIDVDSFKRLNDSQGHSAGDSLLRQIGARLKKASSESALVGRLSSDEFVVVEAKLADSYQACVPHAKQLATELLTTLNGEFDLEGHRFACALSMGICMFRHHKVDAAEILKRADIAMHEAKSAGGNQWRLFDPAMQSGLAHRYQLEQALRSLVNHPDDQLSLHLQPQVNATNKIAGAEALLRWHTLILGQFRRASLFLWLKKPV
ncbi:bifunctional diguanylate cyclase/phosphodiesterase [Aliidiomarina sedimenti]|uniref:Bifunctional diguanylate cyclase/phosphodiesterase n=1 Tax=Aliidiomarina sedimenti TaxID=1933879 RepID=A0ABY0BV95_9GAMM|nr:diguanylate cyclase [Aliidiomarina sedimenti]RUO28035.1 bifunctional diguanylate cyclase/phosphodiesterase [Aliidiomarina sedimenti]